MVTATGWWPRTGVFSVGNARFFGSLGGGVAPILGLIETPDGLGYNDVGPEGEASKFGSK